MIESILHLFYDKINNRYKKENGSGKLTGFMEENGFDSEANYSAEDLLGESAIDCQLLDFDLTLFTKSNNRNQRIFDLLSYWGGHNNRGLPFSSGGNIFSH